MYLIEFFQRIVKKSNISIIAYLILNVFIIAWFFSNGFTDPEGFLFGVAAYIVSLAIALSPVGEFILRVMSGCRSISGTPAAERFEPLFKEVYQKAKEKYPDLPEDVQLFINNDPTPNAFAIGRKTVCLNKGILSMSDKQIKGILAHEIAHLAHKDTDLLLLITVGNFIITGLFIIIRFIFNAMGLMTAIINADIGAWLTAALFDILLAGAMFIWTKTGALLVMHSSRQNEYKADKLAYETGYGKNLVSALEELENHDMPKRSIWATLVASHPKTESRIIKVKLLQYCFYPL